MLSACALRPSPFESNKSVQETCLGHLYDIPALLGAGVSTFSVLPSDIPSAIENTFVCLCSRAAKGQHWHLWM